MYDSRRKSLETAYKGKEIALDGAFLGSLAYGVLCTIFTAVRSERFVSDFKAFFSTIWAFLLTALEKLLQLAKWASQLGDMIPQPIVATIVHWLILIAVVADEIRNLSMGTQNSSNSILAALRDRERS